MENNNIMRFYFTIYSIIFALPAAIIMTGSSSNYKPGYIILTILYVPVYSALITVINYAARKNMVEAGVILMPLIGIFLPVIGFVLAIMAASMFVHNSIPFGIAVSVMPGLTLVIYLYTALYFFKIKSSRLYFVFAFLGGGLSSMVLPEYCYFFLMCSIICGLFLDLSVNFPLKEKGFYYTCNDIITGYKKLINREGHIE
jgi:hypothetical protein